MALNWQWNEKCGEMVVIGRDGNEYVKNLYQGNALLIMMSEWKEDDKDMYALWSFFADKQHAERLLGLKKCVDGTKENVFAGQVKEIRFNKAICRDLNTLIGLFTKAFDNLTITIYSEEKKVEKVLDKDAEV